MGAAESRTSSGVKPVHSTWHWYKVLFWLPLFKPDFLRCNNLKYVLEVEVLCI